MTTPDSLDPSSGAPRLLALGDAAWTVQFGASIDPALHARVQGLARALAAARELAKTTAEATAGTMADSPFAAIVDVVPTFRSLSVYFDPWRVDGAALGEALLQLAQSAGSATQAGRRWSVPVCFDDEFAPDLAALAQNKGLRRDEVVGMLCAATFHVYMIGFMPGFPYMGGLPQVLEVPRLSSPRKAVPARSLAVAGAMCAVYPWQSPGGWHLLGRTPLPMFNADDAEPSLFASGDSVRWRAVDRAEYAAIEAAVAAGTFARASLLAGEGEQP